MFKKTNVKNLTKEEYSSHLTTLGLTDEDINIVLNNVFKRKR